jgi:hypothetical protein
MGLRAPEADMIARRLVQRTAWRRLVAAWLLLLLAALPGTAHAQSDGAAPQPQSERTTGDWVQFVLLDGTWRPLGIYRLAQTDGTYRMEPVNQPEQPGVTPSKGLSDVQFSDTAWRFDSDWGNGDVGKFRLERVAPGVYAGWSYLREEQRNYNLWLLIR